MASRRLFAVAATLIVFALLAVAVVLRPASANVVDGVAQITAGDQHTCALNDTGGIECWGDNIDGQLGDGTTDDRGHPGPVSGLTSGVASVRGGGVHTCAIVGGGVKCWGWNRYGQLGRGTATGYLPQPNPADVVDLTVDIAAIATGGVHTCALTVDGGVKCWGWNRGGQAGDGQTCGTVCTHPVDVTGLTSGVVAVAAGGNHSCALLDDATVQCWGENNFGELGVATGSPCVSEILEPMPCSTTPIAVPGLAGVTAIAAGFSHTCALLSTGGITCWGNNSSGQLGDGGTCGTQCTSSVAVSNMTDGTAIAAGGAHTCAITGNAHVVYCWGENASGQLGNGDMPVDSATPIDVCAFSDCGVNIVCIPEVPCRALRDVSAIALGLNHSCALISTGSVKCWGKNTDGQLGDGGACGSACDTPVSVVTAKQTPTPPITSTLTPIPTPTPVATPSTGTGDANCDGVVNSIDAALVLQYGAGLIASLPCQAAADANHDGSVNAIDAALILQYVAGLLPSL